MADHQFELRHIESPQDVAAASAIGALAYTGYKFFTNEGVAGNTEYLLNRIVPNKEKGTLGGVFANPSQHELVKIKALVLAAADDEATKAAVVPTPGMVAFWGHNNYSVSLFGKDRKVGGLWFVSVGIASKKKGYAKALVLKYLGDCEEREQYLAALHPFRPDFYLKMGFGSSSPYYDYTVPPSAFPVSPRASMSKSPLVTNKLDHTIDQLNVTDADSILACRDRYSTVHHGMFRQDLADIKSYFSDKGATLVFGAHDAERTLRGYLKLQFIPTELGKGVNDIKILEFIHENAAALYALTRFLNQQSDQFRFVRLTTQDPDLYRLLEDPRTTGASRQVVGIHDAGHETAIQSTALMYRVVNVKKLFNDYFVDRDFNGVDGLKIVIYLDDSFTPSKNPPVLLEFTGGKARVTRVGSVSVDEAGKVVGRDISEEGVDAMLSIGVSHFSSLIIGAIGLKSLVVLGKAVLEPESLLKKVAKAFDVEDAPINTIHF
ncbi:UNVERIFIED_CONTAM: hypothetical protein HDU68_000692 [Siphonaria sp. JEL0065]|nr:hypothetical protein HDU68_000692 [Siphonaria sp. JEL0065]